jgi:hypothetical protein
MRHKAILVTVAATSLLLGCGDDESGAGGQDAGTGDAAASQSPECTSNGGVSIDPSALPECPESVCETGGRCVPDQFLPPGSSELLGPCDDTNTCVPDKFVEAGGEVEPEHCRSIGDAEGRCISKCVPQVSAQADFLPQDVCEDDELCAPCFDPRTGEDTSACTLACDMPTEDPVTFATCCEGIGTCVPDTSVPEGFRDQLPVDDCEEPDTLCAPDKFVEDLSYSPPTCTPMIDLDIELDEDGVCLAKCVAEHGSPLAAALEQSSCDAGEVCVPCTDPEGESTGACDI